jgi:hypothetical protein
MRCACSSLWISTMNYFFFLSFFFQLHFMMICELIVSFVLFCIFLRIKGFNQILKFDYI